MRKKIIFLAILGGLCVSFLQEVKRSSSPKEITPEVEKAIIKALDFLARSQNRDGSIGKSNVPVATTAVACLAFMAQGSTPTRGKYSKHIREGLKFLLSCARGSGLIQEEGVGGSGMHGHGYAVLLLSEVLGMIDDPKLYVRVRTALKKGVRLIEYAQNRFGGWNRLPDPKLTDDGSGAVAIMQISALRSARESGISVKPEVIKKAKRYLLKMTDKDGWYGYNYNRRGRDRSSALTGAGMYMLGALDLWNHKKYKKGIRNLLRNAPFLRKRYYSTADRGWQIWRYYTAFYASLAIFQYNSKKWQKWYRGLKRYLLKMQKGDGSWGLSGVQRFDWIFTAFAVLALELPYRLLPAFQAGGRGAEGMY